MSPWHRGGTHPLPLYPFRLSPMPKRAGGRCELCGHFTWQLQVGYYPSQSLHYGAANNTTDKAGMRLPASPQVIIHLGKLPFVLLRDDSGRGCAGASLGLFPEPTREAWRQTGLQKEAWLAVGKWGPSLAVPRAGCVRSGRCFVLSGSPVSHRPVEGSGFKMKGVWVCRWHGKTFFFFGRFEQ